MATLQLNLSDQHKAAAEQRAAAAGYASVDQYIASLIEADDVAPITSDMEAAILKGLDSGPWEEITPQFIDDLKRRARNCTDAA